MLPKKIIYFFPAIVLILVFAGCEKVSNDDPEQSFSNDKKTTQTDLQKFEYSTEDQTLEKITKIVDIALKNQMFRSSLKANAMKMVDGDYDVFIDFDENTQRGVENGLLSASNSYNEEVNDVDNMIDIVSLIKNVPALQLSIPVNCESWDQDNYIPFVAFKPLGYNDPDPVLLKAVKGNEIKWLSTVDAPDKPVVVVGQSERFNAEGKVIFGANYNNDLKYIEVGPGGGSGGGGSGGGSSTREDGDSQYLEKIKYTDISQVESWFSGKPETRLRVVNMSGTEFYSWYDDPNRSSVNDSWKTYNDFMFGWYTNTLGEGLVFQWHEEDPSLWTVTFGIEQEIGGTTISLDIEISAEDDEIGSVPVNFNETYNKEYYPGGIMKFTLSD